MVSSRVPHGEFEVIWALVNAVDRQTASLERHNKGKYLNRQVRSVSFSAPGVPSEAGRPLSALCLVPLIGLGKLPECRLMPV